LFFVFLFASQEVLALNDTKECNDRGGTCTRKVICKEPKYTDLGKGSKDYGCAEANNNAVLEEDFRRMLNNEIFE